LKNQQIDYFVTYPNIPLLPKTRIFVTIAVKGSNFFLCRQGKALCKRPCALHRQEPEKYKQNVEASPLEKSLRIPMWRGLGAIVMKIFRSLLYAILLNGALASWG